MMELLLLKVILCFLLLFLNIQIFAEAAPSKCFNKSFKLKPAFNENRILGGNECGETQWPFVVQIPIEGSGNCTGSIIGDRYILTASHCMFLKDDYSLKPLNSENFKVITESVKNGENGKIYDVQNVIPHSGYNKMGDYDIGLLKLKTPIKFSARANPICLTKNIPKYEEIFDTHVIGFGQIFDGPRKNVLNVSNPILTNETHGNWTPAGSGVCHFAVIPLKSDSHCLTRNVSDPVKSMHFTPTFEICGGGVWKGSAPGDSGGPLIGSINDQFFQIGIVARGLLMSDVYGNPVDFGVYTKVSKYCDWIAEMTKSEITCN